MGKVNVFKECRKNMQLRQEDVAAKLNIKQSAISRWETGVSMPVMSILPEIASLYGVTVDYLLGRDECPENGYVPTAIITFEEIGEIRAGYDGLAIEEHTGNTVTIPKEMLRGRKSTDFMVLRVKGNSMYPKILDGDQILVLRCESVDSGSIAVVLYDSDIATLKQVEYKQRGDWLDLVPCNPEYPTKRIEGDNINNVHILGKVVKLLRDL